jgi:ABC-type dipeptide/oligopeptide/nickel transport system permease component
VEDALTTALVLLVAVAVVAVIGYGLGILIARRLDRWAATEDEEAGDDHRTEA